MGNQINNDGNSKIQKNKEKTGIYCCYQSPKRKRISIKENMNKDIKKIKKEEEKREIKDKKSLNEIKKDLEDINNNKRLSKSVNYMSTLNLEEETRIIEEKKEINIKEEKKELENLETKIIEKKEEEKESNKLKSEKKEMNNIENEKEKEEKPQLIYINDLKEEKSEINTIHNENIPNTLPTEKNNNSQINDNDIDEEFIRDKKSELNDTRSIISSYVIKIPKNMINNNINDSCSISVFSKNDFGDNQSFMDCSSLYKYPISPMKKDGFEYEFNFAKKPYVNRLENQFKDLCDKIKHKENEIKKMNDKINEIKLKIQNCDNENKKYERYIDKEESNAVCFRHMLNFLNSNIK
jgi:structural maintenance of chromosome 3 (chondroitin sulfate proteoglycan 6)